MTIDDALNILKTAGGAAAILVGVGVLTRDAIARWLTSQVDHAYSVKLEHVKAELEHGNAAALETIRRENEQQIRFGATVTAAAAAGQAAAFAHRVECIQRLWKALVDVRRNAPTVAGMTDWLTTDELLTELRRNPSLAGELSVLATGKMMVGSGPEVEELRLMAGENLWSLFSLYRSLTIRVCAYFEMRLEGKVQRLRPNWKDDTQVQQMLRVVLSEAQRAGFQDRVVGGLTYVRQIIEAKFITEAARLLSGAVAASEMSENAAAAMLQAASQPPRAQS